MTTGGGPGPDRADGLPELIRDTIDADVRGLVFPGAMADRVIHGSRARRPWGRAQAAVLAGLTVLSGAGVVGVAALVPSSGPDEGEGAAARPSPTARRAGPSPADVRRLVRVGYLPAGWRA
ncbi:MAG TPA: hypothetical protein VHJ17_02240, partial [Thermomonospora sp.]|nr:hypothetical protein [Thermomonospora sp.]